MLMLLRMCLQMSVTAVIKAWGEGWGESRCGQRYDHPVTNDRMKGGALDDLQGEQRWRGRRKSSQRRRM